MVVHTCLAKVPTVLFFERGDSVRVQVIVNFDLQGIVELNVRIKDLS